jgi:hypothetical protein
MERRACDVVDDAREIVQSFLGIKYAGFFRAGTSKT